MLQYRSISDIEQTRTTLKRPVNSLARPYDCEVMPTPIGPDKIRRLVGALRGHRSDFGWVLETVGANTIAEMSSSQAVRAMSSLQQRRAGGGLNIGQRREPRLLQAIAPGLIMRVEAQRISPVDTSFLVCHKLFETH